MKPAAMKKAVTTSQTVALLNPLSASAVVNVRVATADRHPDEGHRAHRQRLGNDANDRRHEDREQPPRAGIDGSRPRQHPDEDADAHHQRQLSGPRP